MGFQSSFNQLLGTIAGGALGAKHLKGQKESLAEQKMQGQFNVEREVEREQDQNEVAEPKANETTVDKNKMMAERAGQALASETFSKNNTFKSAQLTNHKSWLRQYMDWYGVGVKEAMKAYDENAMRLTAPTGIMVEKVLSTDSDELLNKEKRFKGGNK